MEKKDSFILYTEQKEIFENLTDEQAGKLIKNIFKYIETGQDELDGILKIAFIPIRQNLDRNTEKWEEIKQKRSESGKAGAEKRWKNEIAKIANANFAKNEIAKIAVNVNDNVNVNKKEKNIKKEKAFSDVFEENALSEELKNALTDFIQMRKAIKKPMTTRALELLLRNLNGLTNLEAEKIAILNQSIEHSWQTVYPLKDKTVIKPKKEYKECTLTEEEYWEIQDREFLEEKRRREKEEEEKQLLGRSNRCMMMKLKKSF